MATVPIDNDRLRRRFDQITEIGATENGGVNRPALSDANTEARGTIVEWFEDSGLEVTVDEMGNIFGRREGNEPTADPVLFGSHIDSQYNGGKYDGVVGVLGALETVDALNDADIETKHPLEIAVWSNEEGVRFQPDMLGSGVFCDVFDLGYAYSRTDKEGNKFGDELERIGYKGDEPCEPRDPYCYFELHVEQGPFLEQEGLPLAAVEGVFGFSWMNVAFEGTANHAGPTPMNMRADAMVGASDVTRPSDVSRRPRGPIWSGPSAVSTSGQTRSTSSPNESNSRSISAHTTTMWSNGRSQRIRDEIETAAEREGLAYEFEEIMRVDADPFDRDCIDTVARAIEERGYDYTRLISGAGHDANYLNTICPSSMIFIPSVDGISHRESEFTEWDDVVAGTEVLLSAVLAKANE